MTRIADQFQRKFSRFIAPSKERYFSPDKWDDSWSEGYDLNRPDEDARYGSLTAIMRRYEGEGPILDVGCGDGLLEERYRVLSGVKIVAFDYSSVAIESARKRDLKDIDFFCADSRTFRPQERFSLVVLNESLYYVDDYLGLLKDMSGLLEADGVFIISMHESSITARIWKKVLRSYVVLQSLQLTEESKNLTWRIRVLRARTERVAS
jgi:2-polyprenyl-3-methyl-5-hydroxy-6-metoxy-1,4-benzoquinol methylase